MTPAYASPEQVRGESYTVSSDVYSLGVILYELLAGKRPYKVPTRSYLEMARVICEQEAMPLTQGVTGPLRKQLSGDLERIAAKALAKDPRIRYRDVRELAADLRRYLEGRPVLARPATLRYRAAKLLKRHRIAAPAAALAVALIVGSAAAALWEARRAERRFEQVRSLAHSVLFDLHDAIARLPGSTSARRLLISRALEYLQSLSHEAGNNPDLQREVAIGYERVASVEGSLGESNLGHVGAASENLQKSRDILERLRARNPRDRSLLHDYQRVSNELATAYDVTGAFDKAREVARKSVALAEADARAVPTDAFATENLATSYGVLADLFTAQKQYDQAIPLRERTEQLSLKVAHQNPNDPVMAANLALAEKRLAALYGVTKRYQECREEYERARVIDEERTARFPFDMTVKLDLSYDYSDLGWVIARMGNYDEALVWDAPRARSAEQAAIADPNDIRAASAVAASTVKVPAANRSPHGRAARRWRGGRRT